MVLKLNKEFLPIKAHFFLFFAALGPILPQLNVFGKQLGVAPGVMGLVTAVLPLLWATAKPLFGYIVDYFTNQRKLVFMMLIALMTGSYCCLWFLPTPDQKVFPIEEQIYHLNNSVHLRRVASMKDVTFDDNELLEKYTCHWNCMNRTSFDVIWLTNTTMVSTVFVNRPIDNHTCWEYFMDFQGVSSGDVVCTPKPNCHLLCLSEDLISDELSVEAAMNASSKEHRSKREVRNGNSEVNVLEKSKDTNRSHVEVESLTKTTLVPESRRVEDAARVESDNSSFYSTPTFWGYVALVCIGTVSFNVANCIGDAICFDVLGPDRGNKYGYQRAWGTAGYGITALLGGWLIDIVSDGHIKNFTPAFVLALVFTVFDLIACRRLKLPKLTSPSDSGRALRDVLKLPRVLVFIAFAVVAGTFDSFIIYYMFWYLEELAEVTGHMGKIKLIEGVVVAAQSFGGELVFFFFSGKILKRWGHGYTMTFCLFCYGLRMAFVSFITHPWHLVFIEAIMQGPTYALCYATIVGYAAEVAPEGYSATVQGIVAGMDDGLGFALGSLLGGALYSYVGGCNAFRLMALVGLLAAFIHALLYQFVSLKATGRASKDDSTVEEFSPEIQKMLHTEPDVGNGVYRDTVVPLTQNENKAPSVGTNNQR